MSTTETHVAALLTSEGLSVFVGGQPYVIAREHPNFAAVKAALKEKRYDEIPVLADIPTTIQASFEKGSPEDFEFRDGTVFLDGEPFSPLVSEKVFRMMEEDLDYAPLLHFLRKVRENPSNSAQEELLLFCEANGFLIYSDGDIVAYKAVRKDYRDSYSGTIDNSVGRVVSMPRYKVDDRRDVTCSHGLHFASLDYARSYEGSHLMVLKVNPRDVVSIPSDYKNQKGRCCRYEVIAELPRAAGYVPPKREVYSDDSLGVPVTRAPETPEGPSDRVERAVRETLSDVLEIGEYAFSLFTELEGELVPSIGGAARLAQIRAQLGDYFGIDPEDIDLSDDVSTLIESIEDALEAMEDAEEIEDAYFDDEDDRR